MGKRKEDVIFLCTIIGGIADFIAILMLDSEVLVPIFLVSLLVLVSVIIHLFRKYNECCRKYNERCDFISFIAHLLENQTHKFTLLPKICMASDSSETQSNLHIESMTIVHTSDMRNIDFSMFTNDTPIAYQGNIEYIMNVHNKKIPSEFSCYLGNMYADPTFQIEQKHGCQSKYEVVPPPAYSDDIRVASAIQRFCWQLKPEYITKAKTLPICFKYTHSGMTTINSDNTLVFYPRQYGKTINSISFKINYLCDRKILKRVDLFRIWKDGAVYRHTPISGVTISHNSAEITTVPTAEKCEAYYLRVYLEVE